MFTLSSEQEAIRRTARDFAWEHLAPHAVAWDLAGHFPVDVLRKAAEIGMGGLTVDPEQGGSGLSRFDAALVFEALATGCPTVAAYLSIHNMVAAMVDRWGTAAQRDGWLPRLCGMDAMASYCLTEPGAGSDAAALRSTARRDGDGYVLCGSKQFISGAGASDLYLVMARTGGAGPAGISSFLVPADRPGLGFGPEEHKMGWRAQPTRQVIFDDVRLPATALLGAEGEGFRIAMTGLDGGRLNIAACSLGGAAAALERAITHLGDRDAFGGPLADLQALRFTVADMATELEAARALLWSAAAGIDGGVAGATERCAMAKLFATDVGFSVANRALQLFGGYGYLSECGIEKLVRDLRVHQIVEGTNEIMRVIVARGLLG